MIIDHEKSRPAFEVGYFPSALQRDENKWAWYSDREVQRQWEAWCRALSFVAIQGAVGGYELEKEALQKENKALREKLERCRILAERVEVSMKMDGLI